MRHLLRSVRLLLSFVLALGAATLPACGSMGGGMHYFFEPPAYITT